MNEYSIPDQLLADALIERQLFSREQLTGLISAKRKSLTDSHHEIAGILYRIDRSRHSLLIQESLSLCTLAEIALYEDDDYFTSFDPVQLIEEDS